MTWMVPEVDLVVGEMGFQFVIYSFLENNPSLGR